MITTEQLQRQVALLNEQQSKFSAEPKLRASDRKASYSTIQFLKAAALLEDIVLEYLTVNRNANTHASRPSLEANFFGSLDTTQTILAKKQTFPERLQNYESVVASFLIIRLPNLLRMLVKEYGSLGNEHPLYAALCTHLTEATQAQLQRYLIDEVQTSTFPRIDVPLISHICADLIESVDRKK